MCNECIYIIPGKTDKKINSTIFKYKIFVDYIGSKYDHVALNSEKHFLVSKVGDERHNCKRCYEETLKIGYEYAQTHQKKMKYFCIEYGPSTPMCKDCFKIIHGLNK